MLATAVQGDTTDDDNDHHHHVNTLMDELPRSEDITISGGRDEDLFLQLFDGLGDKDSTGEGRFKENDTEMGEKSSGEEVRIPRVKAWRRRVTI